MVDIPDLDSTVDIVSNNKPTKDFYNWLKKVSDFASAWKTYTPTVTASSGAFTSYTASGRYKEMGKTIQLQIQINITNAGTASGGTNATLPVQASPSMNQMISGREGATGNAVYGIVSGNIVSIVYYNYTFAGATGNQLNLGGTYEAA